MSPRRVLAVALVLLAVALVALGGLVVALIADDGDGQDPTVTPRPTATTGREPSPEPNPEPTLVPSSLTVGEPYAGFTGVTVTVASAEAITGVAGDSVLLAEVVVENGSQEDVDPTFVRVEATAEDGTQGLAVMEPGDVGAGIVNVIRPGATGRGVYAFSMHPAAAQDGGSITVILPSGDLATWAY